jgi:dihydropteroate synthase
MRPLLWAVVQALVIGVVNVTPDSFSDGGRWFDHDAAIAHGMQLFDEGAAVVDVGGESTRPGAERVDEAEELRRVVPVVRALAARGRVSIDTRKQAVAEAAIEAGATLVNDISASLWRVAAAAGVGWVAMHMQGEPATMQADPSYGDVVREVRSYLVARADEARGGGVEEVWIDPGIGFGKRPEHNLRLLAALRSFVDAGYPVLVGTSRKGFLGKLSGGAGVDDRLEASLATATWAMCQGVAGVRVHDVLPTVQAARLVGEPVSGVGIPAAPSGAGAPAVGSQQGNIPTAPSGAGAPAQGEEPGLGPRRGNRR